MTGQRRLGITIRRFNTSDAEEVSCLIRRTLTQINSIDYSPSVIRFLCQEYSSKKIVDRSSESIIYVATADNKILGTVRLQGKTVSSLFVRPEYQGKGVGKCLMKHVESVARKMGYNSVMLRSSITALSFYKDLGYKKISEEDLQSYGRVIVMKKLL